MTKIYKTKALPSHVQQLLNVVTRVIPPLGVSYAVGGAIALGLHGYRRHTDDVDLFVSSEHCSEALHALRAAGMSVSDVSSPTHYFAKFPQETDPDIRIDVLVPFGDPEISAIEMPVTAQTEDTEFLIFSAEFLALSKYFSGRADDLRDLSKMDELGIVNLTEARRLLALMYDEDAAEAQVKEFNEELRGLREKRSARHRPPTRGARKK